MNRWILSAAVLISFSLNADIQIEMERFYNRMGSSVNVNSADIYNGQKAGYVTGGGVTIRNRLTNKQLVNVTLPSFDAGCGGIDIYAGGFSFINSDQLIDTLKSIGSSSVGYAFLLGLETVSPQASGSIKQLQSWANTINSTNINSCEIASQLVGSVWPRNEAASQHICNTVGSQRGYFADRAAARHECSKPQNSLNEMITKNRENENSFSKLTIGNYNVAWLAIQEQSQLAHNQELCELFMTLMGTVIVNNGGGENCISTSYPSKISDEEFLQALLEGGRAVVYHCDNNNQCLNITDKIIEISHSESWLGKIQGTLLDIQDKILDDIELNQEEKDLLAKTRLPIYKIVNVLTAYKRGACPIDIYNVSDIIAMDILVQYLRDALEQVREGCYSLKKNQFYAHEIDDYLLQLKRVEKAIQYYETRSMQQMEREFKVIQQIQIIEEQIAQEFSELF